MTDEKYYSVKAAAEELKLSYNIVWAAVKSGKLRAMQIPSGKGTGYTHRIAETDLLNWFENRKALKTQIVGVTELTVEDLSMELLKRIQHAYDEGFKAGKKAAKDEFMKAMKEVKL